MYFFFRYHVAGEPAPDFSERRTWYGARVFVSEGGRKPYSPAAQYECTRALHRRFGVGGHVTHGARVSASHEDARNRYVALCRSIPAFVSPGEAGYGTGGPRRREIAPVWIRGNLSSSTNEKATYWSNPTAESPPEVVLFSRPHSSQLLLPPPVLGVSFVFPLFLLFQRPPHGNASRQPHEGRQRRSSSDDDYPVSTTLDAECSLSGRCCRSRRIRLNRHVLQPEDSRRRTRESRERNIPPVYAVGPKVGGRRDLSARQADRTRDPGSVRPSAPRVAPRSGNAAARLFTLRPFSEVAVHFG